MSYLSDLGDDSANGTKTVYTKFDLKDEVWLVARNVVVNTMVTKVEIHLDEENQEVKYSTLNEHDIPEKRVFKTKDELFESLKLPVKQDKDVNHDGKMRKVLAHRPGTEVWGMSDDWAIHAKVTDIHYCKFFGSESIFGSDEPIIEHESYHLSVGDKQLSGVFGREELFKTFEELIKSLDNGSKSHLKRTD